MSNSNGGISPLDLKNQVSNLLTDPETMALRMKGLERTAPMGKSGEGGWHSLYSADNTITDKLIDQLPQVADPKPTLEAPANPAALWNLKA